jgi:glutamyl-tRNA reductase
MQRFEAARANLRHYIYLRTCNRVELYCGDGAIPPEVFRHLCRVAAGMESKVIGENHIMGQVKRAWHDARLHNHLSRSLDTLFRRALRIGRKVREQTSIGKGCLSHSRATVQMLLSRLEQHDGAARVLLIGANHLTERCGIYLQNEGFTNITLCNRTETKARRIAGQHAFAIGRFSDLPRLLAGSDLVITATGSPTPIITSQMLARAGRLRIADLAVPADVERCTIESAEVFSLEQIERLIDASVQMRSDAFKRAEQIIDAACARYCSGGIRREAA